ncbi:MAG: hypothetical protein GXO64_04415 [Candidatus Micrarchaeota archaeon]|nr:hypothetical protein [Candidatus Micrarchaeota archaeon]
MKKNYIILGIMLAVLVLGAMPLASAATMDLDVYPTLTSTCPCTTISEMRVFLTNMDTVADTYELSLVLPDGWPDGFIGTYQGGSMLTLGAQEKSSEGDITIYITPSCDAEPGRYTAKVVATSKRTGEKVEKTFMIDVLKCRGVSVNAPNIDMCKGVGTSYSFGVTNEGREQEAFDVSVTSEWGILTKQTLTIEPGETQDVVLPIEAPDGKSGIQKLEIEASSQTSYATAVKTVELNVRDCYLFSLSSSELEKDACLGEEKTFTYTLENNGLVEDTYTISTSDNVIADKTTVTLAPKAKETISVKAKSFEEGALTFNIEVVSDFNPEFKKSVTGTLNTKECKDISIIPAEETEVAKETCFGKVAQFSFEVKNTGSIPAEFVLETDLGTLDKDILNLQAGESGIVTLTIDTASEMKIGETKDISISATSGDVKKEFNAQITAKNCYAAEMDITSDDEGRRICVCDNVDYDIKVKNTGEMKDVYELSFLDKRYVFELAPGEEKDFSYVYGTLGVEPGEKEFKATLRSPYIQAERTVKLNVEPLEACFGVDITVNGDDTKTAESMVIKNTKKVEKCEGVTFSLKLKNTGDKADTYKLYIEGPSWTFLSEDSAILDVGEEREIYVYAAPEYETDLDTYPITVKVVSSKNATDEVGLIVNVVEKGAEESVETQETTENVTNVTESDVTNATTNGTESNETGNVTFNMTVPTGSFALTNVTGRAVVIGLIALAIVAILVIRFFVK